MPSFAGEFTVPGATQEVYELLMDPHRLAKCLPDLKRYEVQDQNHFSVTLRVGLGRVRGPMTMKLEIVEKRENSYARMTGKGTVLEKVNDLRGLHVGRRGIEPGKPVVMFGRRTSFENAVSHQPRNTPGMVDLVHHQG